MEDTAVDKLLWDRITTGDGYTKDIRHHLLYLRDLVQELGVKKVVEFGFRTGNSTLALLSGLPAKGHLESYDIVACPVMQEIQQAAQASGVSWLFRQVDSRFCEDPGELLFIDGFHDYGQVWEELILTDTWPDLRAIVLHDVEKFGWKGQRSRTEGTGILPAVLMFMAKSDYVYEVSDYRRHCNGMLTIMREAGRL